MWAPFLSCSLLCHPSPCHLLSSWPCDEARFLFPFLILRRLSTSPFMVQVVPPPISSSTHHPPCVLAHLPCVSSTSTPSTMHFYSYTLYCFHLCPVHFPWHSSFAGTNPAIILVISSSSSIIGVTHQQSNECNIHQKDCSANPGGTLK
jgi:hypothetical protein